MNCVIKIGAVMWMMSISKCMPIPEEREGEKGRERRRKREGGKEGRRMKRVREKEEKEEEVYKIIQALNSKFLSYTNRMSIHKY